MISVISLVRSGKLMIFFFFTPEEKKNLTLNSIIERRKIYVAYKFDGQESEMWNILSVMKMQR